MTFLSIPLINTISLSMILQIMIYLLQSFDTGRKVSVKRGPTAVKCSLTDTASIWGHLEYEVRVFTFIGYVWVVWFLGRHVFAC